MLLVDHRPVLDGLCVVRVLEGAHRLLVVAVGRREAGDHHGARIAPQRVLIQRRRRNFNGENNCVRERIRLRILWPLA